MRWQSVARAVVALIGIGCAVAVYVSLRPRPAVVEPPKPPLLDASVTAVSRGTKDKRVDETGKEIFSYSADETRLMADGRKSLKGNVQFKFTKNNVRYTVTANDAELSGKSGPTGDEPSQAVFRKKVKMVGDDGFSVEAEDATYLSVEQRVTFPGAVVFNRDRLQGRGVGGELYMDRSVFWLNDQSRMTIRPESGGVPVEVSGKRVGLAQADGYLRAEEGAQLARESQQLFADAMTVYFAEGTQSVRRIELLGKSRVRATGTNAAKRPDMQADNIDLDFAADRNLLTHARLDTAAMLTLRDDNGVTRVTSSVIDFNVGANGETLTRLEGTGPTEVILPRVGEVPAKTIHSNGLVAEGADPKGLNRAVFSGNVQYRETLPAAAGQPAAVRLASSQSLVLNLEGALNQVNLAQFRQKFCFVGPMAPTASPADLQCAAGMKLPARGRLDNTQVTSGDEAEYDAKTETLKLKPAGPTGPDSWVVSQEVHLKARQLDIYMKRDAIDARGLVNFTRTPAPAKTKESRTTGLFDSAKEIRARSNTLSYSKTTGIAKYGGNVAILQVGQEGSHLKADDVTVDDQKHNIEAIGKVQSTFYIEGAPDEPGKKGATATELNSDRMMYIEATRTAVYTGNAFMGTGEAANKQTLEAAVITLVMEAERRALKTLEATASDSGIVLAKLPDGRQATGLKLTYDANTDRYEVTGKPARFVKRSEADPATCDVLTGNRARFPRTGGEATVETEGATPSRGDKKPCAEVLK